MEYLDVLTGCPLFQGITNEELPSLLACLKAKYKKYKKEEFVFWEGEEASAIGIVLSGGVHVVREDFWGNRSILGHMGVGDLFGEAFSCARVEELPVSVLAVRPSVILLLDYRRIVSSCPSACNYHTGLIRNMLRILAGKNLLLTQKIEFLSKRTTREKLLAYLCVQAEKEGSRSFTIPYNRQELADYLFVDRSAMSNELSKMQKEGVLRYHKNQFHLQEEIIH